MKRQIYIEGRNVVWHTGDPTSIYSDRIEVGKVLHVHTAFAYAPERDANDKITMGIAHGGDSIILRAQATLSVQLGMEAANDFFLGEGDRCYATYANVEDGDTIGIHLNGVLMNLSEWEALQE